MRSSMQAVVTGVILSVCFGGAFPARAAAEEPETVKRAKTLIEAQDKMILRTAHPLGKFKDSAFASYTRKTNVHEIVYTFHWTGKEKKQEMDFTSKFAFLFTFDRDGDIDMLEIESKDCDCSSPCFRGANLMSSVLRKQIKKRLENLGIEDKDLLKSLDKMDADGLLAVWLKYTDRKKKK